MKMLVFQKSPVSFSHCTEKNMTFRKIFTFKTHSVFIKCFKKVLFFFFKITLKINDKFLKSRHVSGNSVIKDLNLPFGYPPYHRKKRVNFRKIYFLNRHLEYIITVSHHLADIHFAPQCVGISVQEMNSAYNFFKTFRVMKAFFYHPFSFFMFSM